MGKITNWIEDFEIRKLPYLFAILWFVLLPFQGLLDETDGYRLTEAAEILWIPVILFVYGLHWWLGNALKQLPKKTEERAETAWVILATTSVIVGTFIVFATLITRGFIFEATDTFYGLMGISIAATIQLFFIDIFVYGGAVMLNTTKPRRKGIMRQNATTWLGVGLTIVPIVQVTMLFFLLVGMDAVYCTKNCDISHEPNTIIDEILYSK